MEVVQGTPGEAWLQAEVDATVAIYFRMLRMQELGQTFVKAELIRQLEQRLPARNKSAISRKFSNISAVLNQLGVQAVSGYKPLPNIQNLLTEVIANHLGHDKALDEAATKSVETPAEMPTLTDFAGFVVDIPTPTYRISEKQVDLIRSKGIKRDYLEREARNRSLGHAGELLVMEYEARRLFEAGAKKYVDKIEQVSVTKGDGLGFDILSFDLDGRKRFIEVKTTAYDAETPFFLTPNELQFSKENPDDFQLYRLFSFRKKPQMFALPGALDMHCLLEEASYRATLLGG